MKKIISILLCISLLFLCSCSYTPTKEEKYSILTEIFAVVNQKIDSGSIKTGEWVNEEKFKEWISENKNLRIFFEKYDQENYQIYPFSYDFILIQTNTLYQSVDGYVFSKETLSDSLSVPSSFSYDGDTISLTPVENHPTIYSYSAGL